MTTALTHWYSSFLRRRHTLKHFGRHPLVNAVSGRGPTPAPLSTWRASCCGSRATILPLRSPGSTSTLMA